MDPTDGIRSRVKGLRMNSSQEIRDLASGIENLHTWKDDIWRDLKTLFARQDALAERLGAIEGRLGDIERSLRTITRVE